MSRIVYKNRVSDCDNNLPNMEVKGISIEDLYDSVNSIITQIEKKQIQNAPVYIIQRVRCSLLMFIMKVPMEMSSMVMLIIYLII